MPLHQVAGFFRRLFGRRGKEASPAAARSVRSGGATPEEAVRLYFAAVAAHDLDGILATLAPERARLYNDPRTTLDRQRLSVAAVTVHGVEPAAEPLPLPAFVDRYPMTQVLKVDHELELAPPEQRRDPTLAEGRQTVYFILVSEGQGKPWLIADWGR